MTKKNGEAPAKPLTIGHRRERLDWIVNIIILVPAAAFGIAVCCLLAFVNLSGGTTAATLARSSPQLIVIVVCVGGILAIGGFLLAWYQLAADTAFEGKIWIVEWKISTKAIGFVFAVVGALLIYFSLRIITVIVFHEKSPPPSVNSIVVPPIDPSKVTPSDPLTIPQGNADYSVPVPPTGDTK